MYIYSRHRSSRYVSSITHRLWARLSRLLPPRFFLLLVSGYDDYLPITLTCLLCLFLLPGDAYPGFCLLQDRGKYSWPIYWQYWWFLGYLGSGIPNCCKRLDTWASCILDILLLDLWIDRRLGEARQWHCTCYDILNIRYDYYPYEPPTSLLGNVPLQ